MKIAVIGTTAMGSLYAALLGNAGNEVWGILVTLLTNYTYLNNTLRARKI